jgi:hypothetical protein
MASKAEAGVPPGSPPPRRGRAQPKRAPSRPRPAGDRSKPSRTTGADPATGRDAPGASRAGAGSGSATAPGGKRRGRPPGSVSLTREIAETIVAFIGAGAFAYVAAEAAGISERTFHDWMARGERRHPDREPTPKLVRFARDVRRAQAGARVLAETQVFRTDPKWWLSHAARSGPSRPGWSDPVGVPSPPPLSEEEIGDARERLAARLRLVAERRAAGEP